MPTTLARLQTPAKKCPYGDGARFNAGELATTKASPTSQEISAQGKKYQRGRARTIDVLEREYAVRLAFSKKGPLQGFVSNIVLQ
jgi:hypothetical protein